LILVDPELRRPLDIRVFVDSYFDIRKPCSALLEFVEPSKRYAGVIVPEAGNRVTEVHILVST
jgi:uridine kinase